MQPFVYLTSAMGASAVSQLPLELLGEIFSLLCDTNLISSTYNLASLPALAMSMVCSSWRAATLSLPSIWARIKIIHEAGDSEPQNILHILRIYLSYSVCHPLTLDICMTADPSILTGSDSYYYRILDDLCRESHRWYDVTLDFVHGIPNIDGEPTVLTRTPLSAIEDNLPHLEYLSLIIFPTGDSRAQIFQTCPKLRSLSSYAWALDVPRQNLKTLELLGYFSATYPSRLQNFLLTCPELEELVTYADFENLGEHPEMQATSMSLKSLTIMQGVPFPDIPVWGLVTLPNLQKLDIRCTISDRLWLPISEFSTFLARSKCTITSLAIRELLHSSDEFIISFLRLLGPSLQTLIIHEAPKYKGNNVRDDVFGQPLIISDKLLKTIGISQEADDDSNILLPKLESLELAINSDIIDEIWDSIRDAVESRLHHQSPHIARFKTFKLILWEERPRMLRADNRLFTSLHSLKTRDLVYSVFYKVFPDYY